MRTRGYSVKTADQTIGPEEIRGQLPSGKRMAAAVTLITGILVLGKGIVGHLRGSPALTADAVHSLADMLAIFASWIGLKLAERPPTKRFPFGFYRAETLASLLVSTLILAAGVRLLVESVNGLAGRTGQLHHSLDVLITALLSAVISYGIFVWEKRVGKRLGSPSLLANADESRIDILTSTAVFAGAGASFLGIGRVEMIVTALISVFIVWIGFKHGRVALYSLLDASPDPDLERRVVETAGKVPGVMRVAEVQLRQAGLFWFGIARIQARKSVDITRGHDIAHRVVRAVRDAFPRIESLTVHIEPFSPKKLTILAPVDGNTADARLSDHFGRASFFAMATISGGEIENLEFVDNTAREKKARAGLAAIKHIFLKNRLDVALTREIGEISYHALQSYCVEIYGAPDGPLEQVLKQFTSGALTILPGPTHASEAAGAPGKTD
jgi:cation diffusion facilitator family transporter